MFFRRKYVSTETDPARLLSGFLFREASRIARVAVEFERIAMPEGAVFARKRLRARFQEHLQELARMLEVYGEPGVRLFGEKLRGRAAELAAHELPLRVLLDEASALYRAMVEVWGEVAGPCPPRVSVLLGDVHTEMTFHMSEAWIRRRRVAGDAFREAALLQVVVESLDEAIVVFELDGTVSFATEALEHVIGVSPRQVLDVPSEEVVEFLSSMELRTSGDRPLIEGRLPWRERLLSGEPVHEEALYLKSPDGRERVVELYANPVMSEEKQLRGVIVTVRDRTERHRIFLALEQAYSDLRRMHERVLARSHLETVGGLVQGAAHALNNHLNVLMMKARHVVDEEGREGSAQAVLAAAREMASVLARLQDFAVAPHERPPQPVRLEEAVREMRALTHADFGPASPVRLEVELPPELPPVLAQPDLLVELLTMLAQLARDLATSGHRLHLQARVLNEHVEIVYRAGGRGLEAHKKELESSEPRLAMPTARQMVERWGGRLEVGSEDQSGTLVRLVLAVSPAAKAEEAPAPTFPRAGRKVLVVDDDRDNAEVLAEVLADSGAQPHMAFTGQSAIDDAAESTPDVVLLDLHLPDMEGWEVARRIRKAHPEVRIAVVSGLATSASADESAVDAVFRKPVEPSTLLDFVGL